MSAVVLNNSVDWFVFVFTVIWNAHAPCVVTYDVIVLKSKCCCEWIETMTETFGVYIRKGVLFIFCCVFCYILLAAFLTKSDIYTIRSIVPFNRFERRLANDSPSWNGTMICVEGTLRKKRISVHNRCKVHVFFNDLNRGELSFWAV